MGIGICEYCGRDSNAASDKHIICTSCLAVIESELWKLEPEEPARKAYDRALAICRLKGKIVALREENDKLREVIAKCEKR